MPKFSLIVLLVCLLPLMTFASEDESTSFCERDCKMEYNFFNKYARQGSSLANLSMAIMNFQGHGRNKDFNLANKQLIRAVRGGEPAALYQIAYNLMFGIYIKQDLQKSLIWFKRANKHGVLQSRKFISILEHFLNVKDEEIKSSMKSILSENIDLEVGFGDTQKSNASIERISVTYQSYWSYMLYYAEQQTCLSNCLHSSSSIRIPLVRVINEKALLDKIKMLSKTNNS